MRRQFNIIGCRLIFILLFYGVGSAYGQAERFSPMAFSYITAIKTRITQLVESPLVYERDIPEGKVLLRLGINKQGALKRVEVKESSGRADIDAIAQDIIQRVFPFIPFPLGMKETELWVDVPIVFSGKKIISSLPQGLPVPPAQEAQEAPAALPEEEKSAVFKARLEDCISIAFGNYLHTKVASEQVDLAKLKMSETERALYPNLSGEFKKSDGKTITDPYQSLSYGIQAEQMLIGLEQIKSALERDKIGLLMARKNYDRLSQTIRYEVTKAYYELVSQQVLLKHWQDSLGDLKQDVDMIQKLYREGLTIASDYENAQSQYNLLEYQFLSTEAGASLAKLSLLQAMNLETSMSGQINVPSEFGFEAKDLGLDFSECVKTGVRLRPEIQVWKMTCDSARINEMISRKENMPKLSLSTSYGRSGEAFSNQSLDLVDEWSVMSKLSWLWGPSSMEASLNQDRTLPKNITDTTLKTRAFTQDVKFSLYDKLNYFTTRKEASITYHQSLTELNDARKKVIFEIKEAYLAYKKSLSGIETSLNRLEFRQNEFKVTKAKSDVGEAPPVQLLEAKVNIANDKASYLRSVGEYYLAVAALDKATGYRLKIL